MNSSLCSGALSASATVSGHKDYLNGVLVTTDGTNAATVIVYDNTAASGTILAKAVVAGATNQQHITFTRGVQASIGLYVSIAGTGAGAIVYYGSAG